MIDKQDHNSFMCSFDSLFTNIPLEEKIEITIISNYFRDLLKLTTTGSLF